VSRTQTFGWYDQGSPVRPKQARRIEVLEPLSSRTLRGTNSEIQKLYENVCNVSERLNKAIDKMHPAAVKSYSRALNSGREDREAAIRWPISVV
jgi:hypothetical protein